MKNYRRLAPGEVVRFRDECLVCGRWVLSDDIGTHQKQHPKHRRPVRTDGCPPGWRWADAGEEFAHLARENGDLEKRAGVAGTDQTKNDAGEDYYGIPGVMPYPEDERLEPAKEPCMQCPRCAYGEMDACEDPQ